MMRTQARINSPVMELTVARAPPIAPQRLMLAMVKIVAKAKALRMSPQPRYAKRKVVYRSKVQKPTRKRVNNTYV